MSVFSSVFMKATLKWGAITLWCAVPSFFWGWMESDGRYVPMLLGVATLVVMLSAIESSGWFQARRTADARLACALVWGIRIRLAVGALSIIGMMPVLLNVLFDVPPPDAHVFLDKLMWPDIFIGIGAMGATRPLVELTTLGILSDVSWSHLLATSGWMVFCTTIITGLLHTLILAVLCAGIWGGLVWRSRKLR